MFTFFTDNYSISHPPLKINRKTQPFTTSCELNRYDAIYGSVKKGEVERRRDGEELLSQLFQYEYRALPGCDRAIIELH